MLGQPTETVEDMEGIALLSEKIAETYYDEIPKDQRHGKVQVVASSSFFAIYSLQSSEAIASI